VVVIGRHIVLALCVACATRRPDGDTPTVRADLRVCSYNVNFGVAGDESTVTAIERIDADLVLLQETNAAWEKAFARLSYPHRRFRHPTRKGGPAGGLAILSRFPIEHIDELPSRGGFFVAWRALIATPHGRIQVLNVHLRPPITDGGSWVAGYFTTSGNRLEEIEHHLAALDPTIPTLIAGDFNEERGPGRALARALSDGYGDVLTTLGDVPTWRWTVAGVTLRMQLDHLLHDVHFVPVRAKVVDAGRSDHLPIWADFERMVP
jgi:endonuclease/exonuclease/phosphatase (EEP) superfamily protein YafD